MSVTQIIFVGKGFHFITPMYPSCPSVWQPSPAADKRVDVGVLVTVVGGVDISVVVIVVEEVL